MTESAMMFWAVLQALEDGPVSVDRVAEVTGYDPDDVLADLIKEAGNRGYELRTTLPAHTITGMRQEATK
jgi:predicted Rossmann fold nucleotide-binding protein DprA/Smf involved in DNA uptake